MRAGIDDHADSAIIRVMNVLTLIGTIAFLLFLTVQLILESFRDGTNAGIRSLAGALLPWVILTFILRGRIGDDLSETWVVRITGYLLFVVVGYGIVPVMVFFADRLSPGIPIREVALAGVLSILLYTSVNAFYYGIFTGILLYITLNGFPADLVTTDLLAR